MFSRVHGIQEKVSTSEQKASGVGKLKQLNDKLGSCMKHAEFLK